MSKKDTDFAVEHLLYVIQGNRELTQDQQRDAIEEAIEAIVATTIIRLQEKLNEL